MTERKMYWGLYDYELKVWMHDNNSPPRRQRFFSGIEAYNAAEHHGANIQPRPFYVKPVVSLPADVQELIAAARAHAHHEEQPWHSDGYKRLIRATQALDGKY